MLQVQDSAKCFVRVVLRLDGLERCATAGSINGEGIGCAQ